MNWNIGGYGPVQVFRFLALASMLVGLYGKVQNDASMFYGGIIGSLSFIAGSILLAFMVPSEEEEKEDE